MTTSENKPYLRIATEEAFATKEQLECPGGFGCVAQD